MINGIPVKTMANDSDPPTKRHRHLSSSELFPKVHDDPKKQSAEYYDTLQRHGRVLVSHTNQLVEHHERLREIERSDPVAALHEIEKRFSAQLAAQATTAAAQSAALDKDVTRLRTAVYVAAVLIGGGLTGSTVSNTIKKEPSPQVQIQLPPEVIEALKH